MAADIPVRQTTYDGDRERARVQDLLPVSTRVSWGAIFAGAVVALTIYLICTLLGGAIGFTISDDVRAGTLSTAAAVWAVASTVLALFLGGWVASRCAVGESKMEAVVHGTIMYGVVLFLILWLVGAGMRAGFSAMWGMASFTSSAAQAGTGEDWEAAARRNGVSQETIDQWKQTIQQTPQDVANAVQDPENRRAATRYASQATWYTLLGTLLSLAAAVIGSLVGAGPSFSALPSGRITTNSSRTAGAS